MSYHPGLYKEAIKIHKYKNNFKEMEEAFTVHNTWILVLDDKNCSVESYDEHRREGSLSHRPKYTEKI